MRLSNALASVVALAGGCAALVIGEGDGARAVPGPYRFANMKRQIGGEITAPTSSTRRGCSRRSRTRTRTASTLPGTSSQPSATEVVVAPTSTALATSSSAPESTVEPVEVVQSSTSASASSSAEAPASTAAAVATSVAVSSSAAAATTSPAGTTTSTSSAGAAQGTSLAARGTLLWDGRFNDLTSATDLEKWSWSNQVGPYQYYIHGTSSVSSYVALSSAYANPADTSSKQGARITLDSTSFWNGQTMRRTELIPQTSSPSSISTGKVFYHFSIKRSATNPPDFAKEHQIAFFESHFTELKAGGTSTETSADALTLRWMAGGVAKWSVTWAADVWHNVAYEIDFSGQTVGFWHSTGADALTRVVAPVAVSASSNGADWHVGVLELPGSTGFVNEDLYFSGVYIESGSITTSVVGP